MNQTNTAIARVLFAWLGKPENPMPKRSVSVHEMAYCYEWHGHILYEDISTGDWSHVPLDDAFALIKSRIESLGQMAEILARIKEQG